MNVKEMMPILYNEKIHTWFDLCLFIDRFKENRKVPSINFQGSYDDFLKYLSKGGIAFITFFYSIDGATIEIEKYAKVANLIFKNSTLHFIGGEFHEIGEMLNLSNYKHYQLDELKSFDDWELYHDFFNQKLERGNKVYNELILKLWQEVLIITEKLGHYIEDNDINLLCLINTNSNPGNISLALSIVFISEFLGIPVINNNHDFYWESGHSEVDIQIRGVNPGPRDHFFTNYHLGEVFSILETIYPWESRTWISVNINSEQCIGLINKQGHNPANIAEISTAIIKEKFYQINDEHRKREIFEQVLAIFSNYSNKTPVRSIYNLLKEKINSATKLRPLLIGAEDKKHIDFIKDNIILLQPTRILLRKRIEVNFTLIKKLFNDDEFAEYFEENENLKITLLVTGPISTSQSKYFLKILTEFATLISTLNKKYTNRILLGFLFSEFDKLSFKKKFDVPINIADIYNIASLVLLPSETEGRGLPIIEAAACGTPIFCRRYDPEEVYAKVIGEHLSKADRLSVIEFTNPALNSEIIENVKQQIFSPKSYRRYILHNSKVVEKRFSIAALKNNLEKIFYKLYLQINTKADPYELAKGALNEYSKHLKNNKNYAHNILNTNNRKYLAGYGQMKYMIFLKSLIDPSYFRVEEKRIRGMAMQFAKELVDNFPDPTPLSEELIHKFYNTVDSIFLYKKGQIPIQLDHSFAYRHRNKNYYPYREFTLQELTGVINILFNRLASPPPVIKIEKNGKLTADWHKNLSYLYNETDLAIDDVNELERKMELNIPIAIFPGKHFELELELFVLYPVRIRLGLEVDEKITARLLNKIELAPIFIIQHSQPLGKCITADVLKSYIFYNANSEIKLLFKHGICKIIASKQHSVGLHFYEIGREAIDALKEVKADNGIIIAFGDHCAMMTDIVDITHFHIGQVSRQLAAKIMGIPLHSGYIQWIPAGLRFTLAYPTPIQTGKNLSKTLKSFNYNKLCDSMGEEHLLHILKQDAEQKGTPIKTVLKNLAQTAQKNSDITYSFINGLYADGMSWAGVLARVDMSRSDKIWHFSVMVGEDKPKTVLNFIEEFNKATGRNARVAWNGGYILNPELVGKLGISELFIGSPLGLIISDKKIRSIPLYNKPAFIVLADSTLKIKRINCSQGITVSDSVKKITFSSESYNLQQAPLTPCFYDLLFQNEYLEGNGRILVRLAGNVIKDIIYTKEKEKNPVLPVGITLSFPKNQFPESWHPEKELNITMNGWEEIEAAIEAGPQLLKNGEICVDMELEGWKTKNSIHTQAARIDYLDMRGPKIAIGIDKSGNLAILSINGRIRESVGATHIEMAEILKAKGMVHAMGVDPGGSSTLIVGSKVLNISPYNHEYEKDVYSLPPEPRAVSNALIMW